MEWHVNDLSLHGQYPDAQAFRNAIEPLVLLRTREPLLRNALFSSRSLYRRAVTPHAALHQAVEALDDRNFRRLVLTWLTSTGPFWDDNREENTDDYFEYAGQDVTDQGLGEAARRKLVGVDALAFSFTGGSQDFCFTPILVQHGLAEAPVGTVPVVNNWRIEDVVQAIRHAEPAPRNWDSVVAKARGDFPGIQLSDSILPVLQSCPFSNSVVKRTFELLTVLNQMVAETDETGGLSERGLALLNTHFVGDKAWFSSESETNMARFAREMTFRDPADNERRIFCPWHGKIKTPQYRIHFEWPRPTGQRSIKVMYIGPKITKS